MTKKFIRLLRLWVRLPLRLAVCGIQHKNKFRSLQQQLERQSEKTCVMIIPSSNNIKYCAQNLQSIFAQEYTNFKVIDTDDPSTNDGTWDKVRALLKSNCEGYVRLFPVYHLLENPPYLQNEVIR